MRENVPLAAPCVTQDRDQNQNPDPERELVSPPPGTGIGEPAWEGFYVLVFVASTLLVEVEPLSPGRRIAASVALAAMIPWYVLLGRPVMRLDEPAWRVVAAGSWRGPVYLTGLTALLAVAVFANPNAWFLAFAFSPQCFQVTTPLRRSMGFVIALNVVAGLMIALESRTAASVATAAGTVLVPIAFSQVYSRWTVRVIEQNQERADLIAQLESAQAELAAVHHEAGVLAERQRLAAEIHDTLAQGFLSIVTLIQAAQAGGTAPVGEHLDLALGTARENLAEARALVAALAPASLDDGGLAGALARAAESARLAAGFTATCATAGTSRPLPTTSQVVLLRVCQEALANVRKHAAATQVEVRLRYTAATVELAVADNGRGFVAPAPAAPLAGRAGHAEADRAASPAGPKGPPGAAGPPGTGFGLRGMRERLRQAGGTLTVSSAPGAGTTVRAELPG
jgi:signal transduction histidine kinase